MSPFCGGIIPLVRLCNSHSKWLWGPVNTRQKCETNQYGLPILAMWSYTKSCMINFLPVIVIIWFQSIIHTLNIVYCSSTPCIVLFGAYLNHWLWDPFGCFHWFDDVSFMYALWKFVQVVLPGSMHSMHKNMHFNYKLSNLTIIIKKWPYVKVTHSSSVLSKLIQ